MVALAVMTGAAASAQDQSPDAPAIQAALTYVDEVDDTTVHRLTSDGPDGCLNYMGNMSGEATSWAPDSTRIVYAKRCFGAGGGAGIYVYDLAERRERCISGVGGQWANPIFDAEGVNVYFIDGSDSPRDERGSKPYAVYRVGAGAPGDDGGRCPDRDDVSTRVLDIRAAAGVVDDVRVLTRNAALDQADERFATHVRSDGQWRTIVFDRSGRLQSGWGFGNDNPTHDDVNDGDASIWSPNDPDKIFTNRATGPGDRRARRGIWQVSESRLLHVPDSCGGTNSVAHADWVWHPATGTDVIVGNYRCVWSVDGNGTTSTSGWRLNGYIHVDVDQSSVHGDLADIRFVADEYFDEGGSQPYLYVTTLGDVGMGGAGYGGWSGVRVNDGLVGHRNRLDDGSNNALKAYEPHPQFSPDGRYVLWQSNSLNSLKGHSCPAAACGPAGGDNGSVSYLDIYVAELDPSGPPPPPPPPVEPVAFAGTVSSGDGSVVAGVIVDLFVGNEAGERVSYLRSVETEADGGYRFQADAGCYVATIISPEGRSFLDGGRWSQHARCLKAGEIVDDADAVLRADDGQAATIGGAVTSATGQPVDSMVVDLFRANGDGSRAGYLWSASSGGDGAYTFDVEPGCYVIVFIADDGQRFTNGTGYSEHALCVEAQEAAEIDVRLAP